MTPLTATDAATLTERAQHAADTFAQLLTVLHDGEAWRVLGYPSWTAFCLDKFEVSYRTIQRYIKQEQARMALIGHDSLSRFTGEALEVLATVSPDQMRVIADVAAVKGGKRIGAADVKSIQAAIVDTLNFGAVDIGGEQYAVKDALGLAVQASERERVNASREWIIANVKCQLGDLTSYGPLTQRISVWFDEPSASLIEQLSSVAGNHVRISIWRETE